MLLGLEITGSYSPLSSPSMRMDYTIPIGYTTFHSAGDPQTSSFTHPVRAEDRRQRTSRTKKQIIKSCGTTLKPYHNLEACIFSLLGNGNTAGISIVRITLCRFNAGASDKFGRSHE